MNSSFLKTAVIIAAVSVLSYAVQPPDERDGQSAMKGSSVQAFKSGMKGLRRAIVSDLQDATVDSAFRASKGITLSGAAPDAVTARMNKKLKSAGTEVKVVSTLTDSYGVKHVRLQQFQNEMPIIGGEVIVHVDKCNKVIAVTGQWAPNLSVAAFASPIAADKAVTAAIAAFPGDSLKLHQSPRMVIFNGMMAYEMMIKSSTKEPAAYRCYIDARDGTLLAAVNQILHAGPGSSGEHTAVSGTRLADEDGSVATMTGWHNTGGNYFMYNKDSVWGVYNVRNNDWEQRTSSNWGDTDPAAVSLGCNIAAVQNWVFGTLGRRSFDNAGALAVANVHEGNEYVNAYWDGAQFYFGDGDGMMAGPLTVLDIVGHEYGHAITQYTSDLVYAYEPGALNESYSDIMGTIVEFAVQQDGRTAYPGSINGQADWLCGEDSWIMDAALRDLRDPQRFDQPSYYLGTNWYTDEGDNGGVHTNSGVQNFAFYLLSEGGSGTNDGHPHSITGIGIAAARDIALYANTYLLTADAQYRDSRNAWVLAAGIIGVDSSVVRDVWTAVGLPPLEKHLEASVSNIAFGTVGFGVTDTQWIELINEGGDSTRVNAMGLDNTHFTVTAALPLIIPPNAAVKVGITFAPTGYPAENGSLTILSDAIDNPVITIALTGSGAPPAVLAVEPSSINHTLLYGDTARLDVVVRNNGEADLKFKASLAANASVNQMPALTKAAKPAGGITFSKKNSRVPLHKSTLTTDLKPGVKRTGQAVSVLYLSTFWIDPDYPDSFTEGMRGLENVSSVDVLDGTINTPNLAYLQQYDVVVLSSDAGWADQITLGNTLADYVDNGGRIVMLVASIAGGGGYSLAGRITTEAYMPVAMGEDGAYGYNPVFADHPINTGVTQLECDISVDTRSVSGKGVSLGTFEGGVLVGAYHSEKPIVAINVFPYDGMWYGDLIRMMGNSFNWLNQAQWLKVDRLRQLITVAAGQACTLQVTLDARKVYGGVYTSAIALTHNDPVTTNPFIIPCILHVDGTRMLNVMPATLDFGTVWTDRARSLLLTLENIGSEATAVQSIVSSNAVFTFDALAPLMVTPGSRVNCMVRYQPVKPQVHDGLLTIASDAEDVPEWKISLHGRGVIPPIIACSPLKLQASLKPSESITKKVSLTNTGGADFMFTTATSYTASGTGVSSAVLFGLYGGFIYRINPVSGEFMGQGIPLDSAMVADIGTRGLAFDGSYLYASPGNTDQIEVIDPYSGTVVRRLPLPQPGYYTGLGVSTDYVIMADANSSTVYALDKQTGATAISWSFGDYASGGLVYCSPRQSVFIATYNGIQEYKLSDGTLVNTIYAPLKEIDGMAFSNAAQALFVSSSYGNSIFALDPADGSVIAEISGLTGIDGLAADEAGTGWLSVVPENGRVPVGGTLDLNVTFSSSRVPAGLNSAMLNIVHSQDGPPGPFVVKCALQVSSIKLLSLSPDSIYFDKAWVNYVDTSYVTLTNNGSAPTEIQSILVKGAKFSFGATLPLTVPAYGQARVRVFFRPTAVGTATGQFTFVSNAADHPRIRLGLRGTAVKAPAAKPNPTAFALSILPGDRSLKTLNLVNSGDVEFPFSIRARCSALPDVQLPTAGKPAEAVLYVLRSGNIYQLDPETGAIMDDPVTTSLDKNNWEGGLAFDGRVLYTTGSSDGTILVINPYDGQVIRTFPALDSMRSDINGLGVCGQYLAVSTMYPPVCHILDKTSGEEVASWEIPVRFDFHDGGLTGAGPRQSIYISESSTGVIREHDPLTGSVLREFAAPTDYLSGLAYSSGANLLIGIDYSGKIFYLDPDDGTVISTVNAAVGYDITGAAADEDGVPVKWLSIDMAQGVIPANGGKVRVGAEFDTRQLDAGTYIGKIDIHYTGSRSMPTISVPCTLTVPQAGRLIISPVKLDFGIVAVKTVRTAVLTLSNPGTLPTTISTMTAAAPFGCDFKAPLVIAPHGSVTTMVKFAPVKKGTFSTILSIASDAAEGALLPVILKGTGK